MAWTTKQQGNKQPCEPGACARPATLCGRELTLLLRTISRDGAPPSARMCSQQPAAIVEPHGVGEAASVQTGWVGIGATLHAQLRSAMNRVCVCVRELLCVCVGVACACVRVCMGACVRACGCA